MACIFLQSLILDVFLFRVLSIATWAEIYTLILSMVDCWIQVLKGEEKYNPPLIRVPHDKSKKTRQNRAIYKASRGLHMKDMRFAVDDKLYSSLR